MLGCYFVREAAQPMFPVFRKTLSYFSLIFSTSFQLSFYSNIPPHNLAAFLKSSVKTLFFKRYLALFDPDIINPEKTPKTKTVLFSIIGYNAMQN